MQQVEDLKQQLEEEIEHQSNEKEKLKEMDEVIEVCRQQLQSFDSIN
jgi:uncharacterized membrane protein YccC